MPEEKLKLPIGLKIAVGYLIISGVVGLIWPLTGLGPHHAEYISKSAAYKMGASTKEIILNALLIISGIGLLYRKTWAQKMAFMSLILGIIYGGNDFAWGMAKGQPSTKIYLVSLAIVSLWSAIWFYLIFKKSSKAVFPKKPTPRTFAFFNISDKDQLMLRVFMISIPILNVPHLWIVNPLLEFNYNKFIVLLIGLMINLTIVYWSLIIKKAPEFFFRMIPALFWLTLIFEGFSIISSVNSGKLVSLGVLFGGLKILLLIAICKSFFKYRKTTPSIKDNATVTA